MSSNLILTFRTKIINNYLSILFFKIIYIKIFIMNLTLILFLIGILGFVLNRKNIILMLISIEIMLLFITFLILVNYYMFVDVTLQLFFIFIIFIFLKE